MGPPKPTCLEVFMVNNLFFSVAKTKNLYSFHGFGVLMEDIAIAWYRVSLAW